MLHTLPDELLLIIFQHVRQHNHLDLASISRSCRRFRSLVSDWTVWSDHVQLLGHMISDLLPLPYLVGTHNLSRTSAITLTMNTHTARDTLTLFRSTRQTPTPHCQSLFAFAPATYHSDIIHILSQSEHANWVDCSIRDTQEDGRDRLLDIRDKSALVSWLTSSQRSLATLDLLACPLDWLPIPDDDSSHSSSFTDSSACTFFPCLTSLSVTLTPDSAATLTQQPAFWKRFKTAFPSLQHLTLHIHQPDDTTLSLLNLLFQDNTLFPWINTLTVVGSGDLRPRVNKQQLGQALSTLEGLYRVNMGWDLVALDTI